MAAGGYDLSSILAGIGETASRALNPWAASPEPQERNLDTGGLLGQFGEFFSERGFGSPSSNLQDFDRARASDSYYQQAERTLREAARPPARPATTTAVGGGQRNQNYATGNPSAGTNEVADYIRQAAAQRGIDPEIALKVAGSEGGFEPARRGTFNTGSSWWPFQLHYGGKGYEHLGTEAGMGNTFTAQTGFQPGDPNAWKAATDFALDAAKKSGWGAWYGARKLGITGFMGMNYTTAPQPMSTPQGGNAQATMLGLLNRAGHNLGDRYDWGGAGTAGRKFDCSGLVSWMSQQLGVPGIGARETTFSLEPKTYAIDASQALPGDWVFYNMHSSDARQQHVAIYLGDGKILQSGGAAGNLNIADVGRGAIFRRYDAFTQAINGGGGTVQPAQPRRFLS